MAEFSLWGDSAPSVFSPSDYSGSFGSRDAFAPDLSFATREIPTAPSSGGSWWDSFKNVASDVYGSAPNKSGQGGSGFMGLLSNFGDIAKAVMPVAQIGGGIAQFIAQRDAMDQLKRSGRMNEEAQRFAMENATQARPLATQAADVASDIRGVAGNVAPLAESAAGVAPNIRAAGENVRSGIVSPVQAYAAERLARAQRGEVPPAIQAQIEQWKAGELQRFNDYFARAGIGDSSMMQQMAGLVEQKAQAMAAQYLQAEEAAALQAFDQARVGEATAASIFGGEGAAYGNAANIYGSQVNDLARAAEVLGIGGNILTGGGRVAGGVPEAMQREQQQIEQLIAAANQALARLSGASA